MIYTQRANVIYLMARDDNIQYVKQLRDSLKTDGLIAEIATYEYRLREDFKARLVNRERAIIVMLRTKRVDDLPPPDELNGVDQVNEELGELEVYESGALVPAAPAEVEGVGVGAGQAEDVADPVEDA